MLVMFPPQMKNDWARFLLGAALNLEIWIMLTCNVVVLLCIYRGKLYKQKENPVFVVTSLNMLVETGQLIIHLIYVGPAILSGSWIFDGQHSIGVAAVSVWVFWLWYLGSLNQITMAFNRLTVVCFPYVKFTKTYFLAAFVIMTVGSMGMVAYSQIISPCCRLTPDPTVFGYSYMPLSDQHENLSKRYIEVPIDMTTSILCSLSYVTLFTYIVRMRKHSPGGVKKKEIRLCVQFVIVFLTYTVTWSSFFIFPMFEITVVEAYITTSVVFMANCGINAIILLLLNKEIQREFYKMFGMSKKLSAVVQTGFTVPIASKA